MDNAPPYALSVPDFEMNIICWLSNLHEHLVEVYKLNASTL